MRERRCLTASVLFIGGPTCPALMSASALRIIFSRYGVGSNVGGVSTTRFSRMACSVTAAMKALVDKPREAAKSAMAFLVWLSVLMVNAVLLMMITLYYKCMLISLYYGLKSLEFASTAPRALLGGRHGWVAKFFSRKGGRLTFKHKYERMYITS